MSNSKHTITAKQTAELEQIKNRLNKLIDTFYNISSGINAICYDDLTTGQMSDILTPLNAYMSDTISKLDDSNMDLGNIVSEVKA